MKAVAYSIRSFEKEVLIKANEKRHEITLISNRLDLTTASYAQGKEAVLAFPGDDLSAPVLLKLKALGVKYITTRSFKTDHIDLSEAERLGLKIANVPEHFPESAAEHAITLMLSLCRNTLTAREQMFRNDFTVDNLVGTTIRNKTVGIVGYGETGSSLAQILLAFGAKVLVNDVRELKQDGAESGIQQVAFQEILFKSDIISFHIPFEEHTAPIIDAGAIKMMKDNAMLINVCHRGIFNIADVLSALQSDKLGKVGMDDFSFNEQLDDRLFRDLVKDSRIFITPRQAFLTAEALKLICEKTILNLDHWSHEALFRDKNVA